MPSPPQGRRDFKIALICALRVEVDAVHAVFDKFWEEDGQDYGQASGDENIYTTGVIGDHNVVLVYMPGMGKANAAAVSIGLRHSFPSIKLALVVGICGVIPYDEERKVEIYLGDLIVSTALTQYDFGRQYPVVFKRKDTLDDAFGRPSSKIRTLLTKLQTRRYRQKLEKNIVVILENIERDMPNMRYPDPERDQLYAPTYVHQHRESSVGHSCGVCSQVPAELCAEAVQSSCVDLECDPAMCIRRRGRTDSQHSVLPKVHFGRMGSGDTVMKSGVHRDEIAGRDGIIALEMEGAGVWDQLPCILLKAACDYADSHKTKDWQSRAAAVAAAGTKAFLMEWSSSDDLSRDNTRILRSASTYVDGVNEEAEISIGGKRRRVDEHDEISSRSVTDSLLADDKAILSSLAFHQMADRKNDIETEHHQTCKWLFGLTEYRKWRAQKSGLLWIKGKPGAGKSTLMLFLYNALRRQRCFDRYVHLEFFFSARGSDPQRTPVGMLRSLMYQIFQQDIAVRDLVRRYYHDKESAVGGTANVWTWQHRELEKLLLDSVLLSAQNGSVNIFIDAIDEAGESAARGIAHYFHDINDRSIDMSASIKICISCRHYPVVSRMRSTEIYVEDHNYADIKSFVHDRLRIGDACADTLVSTTAWVEFANDLVKQARGVFLWVRLIVPIMEKSIDDGESPATVRRKLQQVPGKLEDVYTYILQDVIGRQDWQTSLALFQWVCLAERPLIIPEIRFAVVLKDVAIQPVPIKCSDTPNFVADDEQMERQIRTWSGGLLEVVKGDSFWSRYPENRRSMPRVQVVHQTVNDFFIVQGLAMLLSRRARPQALAADLPCMPIDPKDAIQICHGDLYRYCLYYLLTEDHEAILKHLNDLCLEHQYANEVQTPDFPFIAYAADSLLYHARKSEGRRSLVLKDERTLLDRITKYWGKIFYELWMDAERAYRHNMRSIADINDGSKTIHVAAIANMEDLVKHLIYENVELDVQDSRGCNALHCAAEQGHLAIVKLLVPAGLSIHSTTKKGQTPLVLAAGGGHLETVRWLFDHGASLEISFNPWKNALQAAATKKFAEVVRFLLNAGADPNAEAGVEGTALQALFAWSAKPTEMECMVRMLLDHGADADATDGCGSALQQAAHFDYEKVVEMLLDHGASPNIVDPHYDTALQAAARHGSMNMVRMLLDHGADVNAPKREFTGTALQEAARAGAKEVVELLLQHGAEVNAEGSVQRATALQEASGQGHIDVVRILLDHGANVNAQQRGSDTALQTAALQGRRDVVRLLLDRGAHVNAPKGRYFGTALESAMYDGNAEIILMLLDAGAWCQADAFYMRRMAEKLLEAKVSLNN